MLKESDDQWLRGKQPGLIRDGQAVAGTIEFTASYNAQTNIFVIQGRDGVANQDGSVSLSGTFQIRIEERADKSNSRLPALYVQGIDNTPDRHFNQRDNSACLCSPFEEDEFLQPELRFGPFLEQLVIPFLFGQIYYSSYGHWPWSEYAHGAAGILEAYCGIRDRNRALECLMRLEQDRHWPGIRSALRQSPYMKGHTLCFCTKKDQIRRCHPGALKGALLLQQDLRALGIPIS